MSNNGSRRSDKHVSRHALQTLRVILIGLCMLTLKACSKESPAQNTAAIRYADLKAPPTIVEETGQLSNDDLKEISGLARSMMQKERYWAINDSGNSPTLFALTPTGEIVERVSVDGTSNKDWEDLASFQWRNESWLLIADVGDNLAWRSTIELLLVREPKPGEKLAPLVARLPISYEDGARDCEALTVDLATESILLLSKRDDPPGLYSLPLSLLMQESTYYREDNPALARKLGTALLPPPDADDRKLKFGEYSSQPSAMDLHGDRLLVMTYRSAYVYVRKDRASWADTISKKPFLINIPRLKQQESVAWQADGLSFIYLSEGKKTPIISVRLD